MTSSAELVEVEKTSSLLPETSALGSSTTFSELGVCEELCTACKQLNWLYPTAIQKQALPVALKGHDIIGVAKTRSGKTAAFAIPILQALRENPQRIFALVLTPTRELANQIGKQFEDLGASIDVKCAIIVRGCF